ncbi:hypothetical protein Goklo_006836, partial [Gossypium klotzschianum]|nr:hypothetical protein [Gossypium klotzschianum]
MEALLIHTRLWCGRRRGCILEILPPLPSSWI